jgi:hypothetical protein
MKLATIKITLINEAMNPLMIKIVVIHRPDLVRNMGR